MAKTISSLSVTLGATVAPFVNAFSGIGGVIRGFVSSIEGAGSAVAKFSGLSTGVAAAMRAVRGAAGGLLGTFATFTGAGLAVNAISGALERLAHAPLDAIAAAKSQADAEAKLRAVLTATGGAAGRSADQLIAYAQSLESSTTFSDDAIVGFQATLTTFKNISGDVFDSATKAALDMATVMGTDLQTTAVQLGKALNDPVEGVTALRRVGVSFTDAQLAQIKAMSEANNVAGAQAIVLKELQSEFGGAAEAVAKTPFGKIAQLGNAFEDALKPVGGLLASVATEIADALNLKGIASSVESTLAGITPMIQGAVATYLPIVLGFASRLWQSVVGVGSAIAAYVSTAVAPIVSYLATNWQSIAATAASYLFAVYGYVSGAFSAVLGIVVAIGGLLVNAWNGSMSALGLSTMTVGGTTSEVFGQIGRGAAWLAGAMTTTLTTIGYLFTNWRDVAELVLTQFSLGVVTAGNQVAYVFGTVVRAYLNYLAENWRNIFLDILHTDETILANIGANLKAFFAAVSGWLHGDGFNFEWTGLTEGFKSSMGQLPTIAERQMGGVESALAGQLTGLQNKIGDGLGNALAGNKAAGESVAKNIADAIGSLPPIKMPAPIAVDTKVAIGAMQGLGDQADETAEKAAKAGEAVGKAMGKVDLIASGSAEQWQRIAKAQADALNPPTPAAAKIKGTPTPPGSAAAIAAAAQPVGFGTPAWFQQSQASDSASAARIANRSRNWLGDAPSALPSIGMESSADAAARAARPLADAVTSTLPLMTGKSFATADASNATPMPVKVDATSFSNATAQPVAASVQRDARDAAKATTPKAPVDGAQLMQKFDVVIQILRDKGLLAFEEVG